MNPNNASRDPRPPRLASTPVSDPTTTNHNTTIASAPSRQSSRQTQDAFFTPAYERSASELVQQQQQQRAHAHDNDNDDRSSLPYDLYADTNATPRKERREPLYAEPEPLGGVAGLNTSRSFDTINTPTRARHFFPADDLTGADELTMDRSATSDSRAPLNAQAAHRRDDVSAAYDTSIAARDYGHGSAAAAAAAAAQVHYPPSAAMRAEPSTASAAASEDEGYARLPPGAAGGQMYTSIPLEAPVNGSNGGGASSFTASKPPSGTGAGGKKNRLSAMFGKGSSQARGGDEGSDAEKGAHQRLASTEGGGRGGRTTRFAADPAFPDRSGASTPGHGTPPRSGLRSGLSTPAREWEGFEFNTAQASVENLRYADGDVGKSKVSHRYEAGAGWEAGFSQTSLHGMKGGGGGVAVDPLPDTVSARSKGRAVAACASRPS